MRQDNVSPFLPGLPVPIESFVGRRDELEQIKRRIDLAAAGRVQVLFIVGERGIGKTSAANVARLLGERLKMVGVHVHLGGTHDVEGLVYKVFDRLIKATADAPWFDRVRGFFAKYIQKVDLFGLVVELRASQEEVQNLTRNFVPALRNVVANLKGERDGVLLILDDINGLASSEQFANWLKSTVDEMATSGGPMPLCIILIGTEERRESLIGLQPSLARLFDVVEVAPWSPEETREFFRRSFASVEMTVSDEALQVLEQYSGGLPVLAHEIGEAAFYTDLDSHVDFDDALAGIFSAADVVGKKYLQPQVITAIRSPHYRTILRKISREKFASPTFSRASSKANLSPSEQKVLDNFLRRMESLGVIVRDPEAGAGCYRFTNSLHRLYFALEAGRGNDGAVPRPSP